MAAAFKCDRCAEYSDGTPPMIIEWTQGFTEVRGNYAKQLCTKCKVTFHAWFARQIVRDA